MQGVGDSQGGFFARLTRQLQPAHPDWTFVNLGIGGDTTSDMLKRIDAVEAHRPFTSVIILGCNDVPRDNDRSPDRRNSPADYLANLESIFAKLYTPGSLFIASFPSDGTRSGVQRVTMDRYIIPATALARRFGFAVWDLYSEMKANSALPDLWASDGNHFNDAGHAMIAERVVGMLRTNP